jgi:hypothetical protein
MNKQSPKKSAKRTKLSLKPLSYEEAVEGLLAVKPEPKPKKKGK